MLTFKTVAIKCSLFPDGFLFQNHYPRFRGAPSSFFKGLSQRPSLGGFGIRLPRDWISLADNQQLPVAVPATGALRQKDDTTGGSLDGYLRSCRAHGTRCLKPIVEASRASRGRKRSQVASKIDDLLSIQRIAQIEENLDSVSNPTLVELRCLAAILKTTVAELVEPDLGEHVIKVVKDLMMGNVAARYGTSSKDQRAMVSSMLHRLLVALDNS